jgi:hypothetical protein
MLISAFFSQELRVGGEAGCIWLTTHSAGNAVLTQNMQTRTNPVENRRGSLFSRESVV